MATVSWQNATILLGASLSAAIEMKDKKLVAFRQPADTEGTAFGLQASWDRGKTYAVLYRAYSDSAQAAGAAAKTEKYEVIKSASLAQVIFLVPDLQVEGPTHIKVITEDGAGTAVDQTVADSQIEVAFEDVHAER